MSTKRLAIFPVTPQRFDLIGGMAAKVAAMAGAGRLLLVHLPPEEALDSVQIEKARAVFPQTEKGEELGRYSF